MLSFLFGLVSSLKFHSSEMKLKILIRKVADPAKGFAALHCDHPWEGQGSTPPCLSIPDLI